MHTGFLDVFHHASDQHVAVLVSDHVDVNFDRVVEESVEQHRRIIGHLDRVADVARQVSIGVHDFHRAAAKHVAWPHHQWITDLAGQRDGLLGIACRAVRRLSEPEPLNQLLESFAVLGQVD